MLYSLLLKSRNWGKPMSRNQEKDYDELSKGCLYFGDRVTTVIAKTIYEAYFNEITQLYRNPEYLRRHPFLLLEKLLWDKYLAQTANALEKHTSAQERSPAYSADLFKKGSPDDNHYEADTEPKETAVSELTRLQKFFQKNLDICLVGIKEFKPMEDEEEDQLETGPSLKPG